ncbi:MAG: hypothetical protein QM759_05490 [Terricaulis sp.]
MTAHDLSAIVAALTQSRSLMKVIVPLAVVAIAVFAVGAASGRDARQRDVEIVNDTGVAMNNFYASNAGLDQDTDLLGNGVIAAHASKRLNLDDGSGACLYDFRAIFIDGGGHTHAAVRRHVNVCTVTRFRFTSID